MYTEFFGLTEIPFSIAPNPSYLFMSERHKEALAHLTYGLGTTGGFVLLTGEVGTGKTTVSRCILDGLSDDTQAAFILNPTLSSQELLATICDELGIFYNKAGATLKSLTDKIQEKLLENHALGINTLLIIDEAQHLKAEVLEQLRLLTNLETNTKKLLQVILIGQPELQTLLKRQDLRQLAQRITARYHLLPLNKKETEDYIIHRLLVAGCQQKVFTGKAISTVHALSKGIPRLINLLCDRALLGAFGNNKSKVDHKLVIGASIEALGEEYHVIPWWKQPVKPVIASLTVIVIAIVLGFYFAREELAVTGLIHFDSKTNDMASKLAKQLQVIEQKNNELIVIQQQLEQQAAQKQLQETQHQALLQVSQSLTDLPTSVSHLFSLWKIAVEQPITEPCKQANIFQLACYWHQGNLSSLVQLNYPAVFKFYNEESESFYGLLVSRQQEQLTFKFDDKEYQVTRAWLDKHWRGGALVFWQAPIDDLGELTDYIAEQDSKTLQQWLEDKLSAKQQRPPREISQSDPLLKNQLQQFKRQNGIVDSSYASTTTLMLLANSVEQGLPIFPSK